MDRATARTWAREEFGGARLGDTRLRARLVAMATQAFLRPSGRVSEVFSEDAARQGAYDFLESPRSHGEAIFRASQQACVERSAGHPYVFVPVDGTSLTLTDRTGGKDFGGIGAYSAAARGLKVIDAIAVSPAGTPLGLAAMRWWVRGSQRLNRPGNRRPADRETQHWVDAVHDVAQAFGQATRAWFQLDREGDAWRLLRELSKTEQLFTVRSNGTRRLRGPSAGYLRPRLRLRKPVGHVLVEVPETAHRSRRVACMAVRTRTVTLDLDDKWTKTCSPMTVQVVHVREVGKVPRREKPLDWMLLTNFPVQTLQDAEHVIFGYTQRWRIEDLHRTWKSGVCNVESTQLRRRAHVIAWATLLAAVAARVERLKHLAREQPDRPATDELSPTEARALVLLARKYKRRTETIPDAMTIAQATDWIARLGGYTGKSSGGPPGSITIGRGLDRLRMAAEGIDLIEAAKKPRTIR